MDSCRKRLAPLAGALCVFFALADEAAAQRAWTDRAFVNVSLGQQWMDQRLATSGSLDVFEETATWETSLDVDDSFLVDVGGGFRVWKNFAIGAGFTRTTDTHDSTLSASIPDTLRFDAHHADSREITGLKREERIIHLSAVFLLPVTDRIDVALSAGPSFFTVTQPFVNGITVTSNESTIDTVSQSSLEESATGYHVAIDGTVSILRNIGILRNVGVGFLARYSTAKIDAPDIQGGSIDAGGFQGLAGARIRF